jgi:hypothetical protein
MPYIDKNERIALDNSICHIVETIKNIEPNCDFSKNLGRINYVVSCMVMGLMGNISYSKIAMATGVLENIKQEFYRRAASHYEDKKIEENGDIKEYS